jgi:hypothetical protein
MSLATQQHALQAAVSAGASADGLLHAGPGLAVYQEAYRARLLAALRDNFTVLQRALGDEAFDALAMAYLQAHPSTRPSIRWFGDRLAAFMDGAWAEQLPHPAMADFARMDWALRAAFDAADAPVLRPADLQALAPGAWPGLRFALHPSVHLQPMRWAIEPAWRALREHEPGSGAPDPVLAAPEPLAHTLLVWRQGLDTRWRALPPVEAGLLQAVAGGETFEAVCGLAAETAGTGESAEQEGGAVQQVVRALQRWLSDGLLCPGPD